MRVEPQTADKILGIIRVADIDPGAIENAQRIVEFIAPKASPGLDSNIPFLNKLGVAELRVIKLRLPGELEVKVGTAGKWPETSWRLGLDAEADPLLTHSEHNLGLG